MKKDIARIGLDEAKKLLDFRANGVIERDIADGQLRGAVALHNILASEGFAYLADEVGMGKTYIALGVLCLLRFAHPNLRVLVIAPKQNIQEKWLKDWKNLVKTNYRATDLLVRSFQGLPTRPAIVCSNLVHWAIEAVKNPDRDTFIRLPSFSFGLSQDKGKAREGKQALWNKLAKGAPMLKRIDLDPASLDNDAFKDAFARGVNALLPHYDLVIVDEAHNLKHGYGEVGRVSSRNRLLALTLGSATDGAHEAFPSYGRRFDRVLFLSATPLESDYAELYRQLALFGFGEAVKDLHGEAAEEHAKKILIRRLTRIHVAGEPHTKNMYRREWRGGGVTMHDEPLEIPNDEQRLTVALVQRKVAEVIRHPKFDKTFQMGMLASFESFGQTAGRKKRDAAREGDAVFAGSDQTDEPEEREGADVDIIGRLRQSYSKNVEDRGLPHPKMDAVVASLVDASLGSVFDQGDKALIFVRRVASVREIGDKLRHGYDAWIEDKLRQELGEAMSGELRKIFEEYRDWRRSRGAAQQQNEEARVEPQGDENTGEAELVPEERREELDELDDDVTFFAWFFRGKGPEKRFSGASFRNNQLQGETSPFGTFFEENYVALLLGPAALQDPLGTLVQAVDEDRGRLTERLRGIAATQVQKRRGEISRRAYFEAYQAAALVALAEARSFRDKQRAETLLEWRFPGAKREPEVDVKHSFPGPEAYLGVRTFFSEVERRPALAQSLFPEKIADSREFARDRELRRELLAHAARLGHSFITLFSLAARMFGSLEARRAERGQDYATRLIDQYCDRLETERGKPGFSAMRELESIAEHFHEIFRLNFEKAAEAKNTEAIRKLIRDELSSQRPVAGMSGGVTPRIVKQFRMPGYPVVLVTTDVLKEGEDLHTFCSKVIHYGIAWNPSEMEQKTGRIDRIGSATHRRLAKLEGRINEHEKLQTQYPYLLETVERLQMARLFRKMNKFVRSMHTSFGGEEPARGRASAISVDSAFAAEERDIRPIEGLLETKFEVDEALLCGSQQIDRQKAEARANACLQRFAELIKLLGSKIRIDWHNVSPDGEYVGTTYRRGPKVLRPEERDKPGRNGVRQQPILLYVEGAPMGGRALIHLTSPVGRIDEDRLVELFGHQTNLAGTRICLVEESKDGPTSYTVTVEGDILLDPQETDVEELYDLIAAVALGADDVEGVFLSEEDRAFESFAPDLRKERDHGAH
ncbi:MAG: DEAD/DEAH box helicase family protein [Polyangiaceae bacterium]|nr:DEAD/DEAH box helicase family protein [Polyangiaceae bacterium]